MAGAAPAGPLQVPVTHLDFRPKPSQTVGEKTEATKSIADAASEPRKGEKKKANFFLKLAKK